jgi:hypothetical protein
MTRSPLIWLLVALILIPIQASAASRGLELELRTSDKPNAAPAGSIQLYQASYALVIGIDRYTDGWPALRNAVNDARAVATKLKDHGFEVTLRENLKADDFRKTLREFFARTGRDPEARLLLWYAGHGHTVDGEGFLVPADAPRGNDPDFLVDALPLRDFGSLVRLAKSKHVLSIFDACFAGTVFEARGGVPTAAITSKTTKPVRQFITSGDAGQQVRDDGSFREYFLRALSGDEKADFNDDGYVTGEELGLFLSQRMTSLTQASQTPKSGKLHDVRYNQGDFVFALERPADVAAPASGSGFSLGDLKKQQKQDQVKQAWAAKLTEMKAAYAQTKQFEAGDGSSELKAQAWQRFVTAFAQDNPFSTEDDQLRRQGASQVRHWLNRKQVAAVTSAPKINTLSPDKPNVKRRSNKYRLRLACPGGAWWNWDIVEINGKYENEGEKTDKQGREYWWAISGTINRTDGLTLKGQLQFPGGTVITSVSGEGKFSSPEFIGKGSFQNVSSSIYDGSYSINQNCPLTAKKK